MIKLITTEKKGTPPAPKKAPKRVTNGRTLKLVIEDTQHDGPNPPSKKPGALR